MQNWIKLEMLMNLKNRTLSTGIEYYQEIWNRMDRITDFFDMVVEVLQEHTLAPYLLIICLDYILQTLIDLIKENGFTLK